MRPEHGISEAAVTAAGWPLVTGVDRSGQMSDIPTAEVVIKSVNRTAPSATNFCRYAHPIGVVHNSAEAGRISVCECLVLFDQGQSEAGDICLRCISETLSI